MKAAVKEAPRPGISLLDMPEPVCGPNDILLRIKAVAICGSDLHAYKWDEWAEKTLKKLPVILGHEFMGEIAEIGRNIDGFKIGERVAVDPVLACRKCTACRNGQFHLCENRGIIGTERNGAFAKYTLVPPDLLYRLPDNVTDEEGAFLEIFALALHAVERSHIKPGDTVVVVGAGPIGLSTLICAKAAGATKIFVMARNSNVRNDAAKIVGADAVVNTTKSDPIKEVLEMNAGKKVDAVFEVSGNPVVIPQAVEYVKKGGEIIVIGSPPRVNVEIPLLTMVRHEISLITVQGRTNSSWYRAINLLERVGVASILGPTMPLEEIEEAFRQSMNGEVTKLFLKPE